MDNKRDIPMGKGIRAQIEEFGETVKFGEPLTRKDIIKHLNRVLKDTKDEYGE